MTLTIPRPKPGRPLIACAEWAPTEPNRLTAEELKQYRQGRHVAITSLAAELGITVALLEL